ncbi:MAG: OmpA family protein [Candidatus Binatia bacterium]|jgi:outer membrane protein OmpA-like peptidoglycan-associated protein
MRARWGIITVLIALTVLPGCEYGRRFVRKPWGKGTYIPAAVCAVVGAGAGVGIQEARRGTSTSTVCPPSGPCLTSRKEDDADYWKGALIGTAIGAGACALAGHYLLDPEAATAPPPPPPPPLPTPQPLPPPSGKRIVLRGVHFDFNKSDIRPDSRPILNEAGEILKENPDVRISVEGHTDAIGSDQYNQQLSLRRAEAVFRYLVNHGIPPERMEVIGYGKRHPVASNDTDSGRAQNRRVELRVVSQTQELEP